MFIADSRPLLVLVRGDHSLVEQKLLDATGARAVRPADADEIKSALGALPGSLGAVGVTGLTVLADHALAGRTAMTTGANQDGVHLRGVDLARDITVTHWADLREVRAGEPCIECGTALQVVRTVEVGHIFKLGYKYTEALGVTVLGQDGTAVKPIMGSYGIGIERAIAAIVETHHDEKGIVWPAAVAPFEVAVVPIGKNDEQTAAVVDDLYAQLRAERVDVVLDDRDERPGVKFADIELVGIPYRITVGPRGLKEGVVEVTTRATGETTQVPVASAAARVAALLRSAD